MRADVIRINAVLEEVEDRDQWKIFLVDAESLLGYQWPWKYEL